MSFSTGAAWLSACRLYARRHAPCMTAVLLALVPREIPGLGTMGVTADGRLFYDPDLRGPWTVRQGATVLLHEAWHVLRRHAGRAEVARATGQTEARLWNVAADAEINDDIPQEGVWRFPETGVDGSRAPPVLPASLFTVVGDPGGMPNGHLAEGYYAELRKRLKPSGLAGSNRPGPGWCGSGAGCPLPGEPDPDGKGRTPAELERVRRTVAEAVKTETSKGRGSTPGGWVVWADTQLDPPKIPWQTKLSKIVRSSVEWAQGAVDYRYGRPSRRQGGVGCGPGRPILPALMAPKPEVLVIVDTSGSMGKDDLTIGLREVKGVLTKTSAHVTFAAADAAVHEMRKVRTWQEVLPLLKGGGGTDFGPAFAAAQKMRPRPQVLLFVTDGDGACPADPPLGMRTIWLLVGEHRRNPANWGEIIEMEE